MSIEYQDIQFVDNPLTSENPDNYVELVVDAQKVLKSWQKALYAFEWLLPDGRFKDREELSENDRTRCEEVDVRLQNGEPLDKPILGIGLLENVEIGSGRAVFAVVTARGATKLPVHVRKSHAEDFAKFVVE